MKDIRQVIVLRTRYPDPAKGGTRKVRSGKLVAQGAHASMAFLTSRLRAEALEALGWQHLNIERDEAGGEQWIVFPKDFHYNVDVRALAHKSDFMLPLSIEEILWVAQKFTKICLYVDTEEELLAVYRGAKEAGLTVHLIKDAGDTEFGGEATYTALAVGPHLKDKIDPVTGNLPLY